MGGLEVCAWWGRGGGKSCLGRREAGGTVEHVGAGPPVAGLAEENGGVKRRRDLKPMQGGKFSS